MPEEKTARKVHGESVTATEKGDFIEALRKTDEALVLYQQENDALGFAEIQAMRFLILRHLFDNTCYEGYLILAKFSAMSSVEIAQKSHDPKTLALPFYNLAKVQEDLSQYSEALSSYQSAIDNFINNPPDEHNRPGVLADMKIHLHVCRYKNGEKEALSDILSAISELEATDEPKFNKDVWMSGGYMKLAELLKDEDSDKAQEYLQKAKVFIDANPELILRKGQWEKLAKTF
jgi:tetratricopeptide (TPR) repeat protein